MNPLCACGCGLEAPIAKSSNLALGRVRGLPAKYIHGHNATGRRREGRNDYLARNSSSRPCGRILQHVEIAEKALGRRLPKGAQVHHVDGNKRNNATSNLVICQDGAYHQLLHVRTRIVRAGGNPNTQKICTKCGEVKALDAFNKASHIAGGRASQCRDCSSSYQREWERSR